MAIEYPREGSQQHVDRGFLFPTSVPFSEPRPDFVPQETIEQHAERIKKEVTPHILTGISKFIETHELNGEYDLHDPLQQQAWIWAVKSSKYNAAYFFSRRDAQENGSFVTANAQLIDTIGAEIDNHGGVSNIANYALHSYVEGFTQLPGRAVQTAKRSIPPNAIQGKGFNIIAVKPAHFLNTLSSDCFSTSKEIHDWHDLAHVLAASSSYGKFGVKYNEGLNDLERYCRALTEGEGMSDASGPAFSDGLLFTQLSKPLFENYEGQKLPDGSNKYSNDEIESHIAGELFLYLGGHYPLFHPGVNRTVMASRPINTLELAVGEQNKRYERRAAEVEIELLVRGTPEGVRGDPGKDPLVQLTRSQRIQEVARLDDGPLYFEARNLIRHRAHEDALGQYAAFSLQSKKAELATATDVDYNALLVEVNILQSIVDFYQMTDLKQETEINLYQLVGATIAKNRQ